MSSASRVDDQDMVARAVLATDNLYLLRDTYFPENPDEKISKLRREADLALKLLDSIPSEERRLTMQRATYEYLRGKILDVFPDYRKEAEDHLSKAVKLNPSLFDAWCCLGNCIWKKGDLISAKNCFTLALSKGPDKRILCQLSMLERVLAQGKENEAKIVEESIQHAKEAVALDVKEGNSWYCLGNACLTSFFVTGSWDYDKLMQSLKAYQNAEKDERMKSNPDLYFNSATVNKYLENYERALSGFEAAALKDPGLNATKEVEKLVNLLDNLDYLLKGQGKAKRLDSLASSLGAVKCMTATFPMLYTLQKIVSLAESVVTVSFIFLFSCIIFLKVNSSYKRIAVEHLLEGLNKAVAIVGRVLFFIKQEGLAALYYIVYDSSRALFVLSVYGIHPNVIKEGDQLTIVDPNYRNVDYRWKGKHYQFKSVRVDFLEQVLVNGKTPSPNRAYRSRIYAQHKP